MILPDLVVLKITPLKTILGVWWCAFALACPKRYKGLQHSLFLFPLQEAAKARLQYPNRPEPLEEVAKQPEVTARNFPESVDKIPLTMA